MVDLTDNPYEEAYPEEVEKLRDDIDAVFEAWENGNLSRPAFSNELLGIASSSTVTPRTRSRIYRETTKHI